MSINQARWSMPEMLALKSPKENNSYKLEASLIYIYIYIYIYICYKQPRRHGRRIPGVAHANNFTDYDFSLSLVFFSPSREMRLPNIPSH